MTITLFASEVSSACGFHPYRKVHETFITVLNRITEDAGFMPSDDETMTNDSIVKLIEDASNVDSIRDIEACVKKIDSVVPRSFVPEVDKAIKIIDQISKVDTIEEATTLLQSIDPLAITDSISNIGKIDTLDDVIEVVEKLRSSIRVDTLILDDDRTIIAKNIESKINCNFGSKQESIAIATYEKQLNISVDHRNDKFHKRKVGDFAGHQIFVGGKVDGIKEDGTVIEVKNRMRRFFDPLPRYDLVQLQTYLFILNTMNGELVEQLKGDTSSIKITEIRRDPEQWDSEIKPRILKFCKALITIINNPSLYEKLRDGYDCENIVRKLLE